MNVSCVRTPFPSVRARNKYVAIATERFTAAQESPSAAAAAAAAAFAIVSTWLSINGRIRLVSLLFRAASLIVVGSYDVGRLALVPGASFLQHLLCAAAAAATSWQRHDPSGTAVMA